MAPRTFNLPVSVIKQIEPILKECIGYSWELFVHEYSHIIDIYIHQDDQTELNPDYEEYVLIPPLSREKIPLCVWSSNAYDFSMEIGKCLPLPWIDKPFRELVELCAEHEVEKNDNLISVSLLILSSIYQKYKEMPDFGWGEFVTEMENTDYTFSTRPDLLKLYCFINETDTASITIKNSNGEKMELDNRTGWFQMMAQIYLNKRLCVSDIKEAQEELNKDYSGYKKKGRNKIKPEFDFLLMGCYNLIKKHSTLNPPDVLVSNKTAEFIIDFLNYVGILAEMSEEVEDIQYIRAKIKYLLQTKFEPVWYKRPDLKDDPDDIELANGIKKSENYLGNIIWQRHPILEQREFQKLFNKQE